MGRKPNTEQRRAQILDALLAELASVGYERASVKSIAARAGLAPGLVHYHFESKLDMLLALVDIAIAQAEARFAAALAAGGDARVRLTAFVDTRVGLGAGADLRQVRAWVVLIAEAMGQPRVRRRVARWLESDRERLAALFAEAGASDPDARASALLALVLGSFSLHAIKVRGVPRGYARPQILGWLDSVL